MTDKLLAALLWQHQCATSVKLNAIQTASGNYLILDTDYLALVAAVDEVSRLERKERPQQLQLLEAS